MLGYTAGGQSWIDYRTNIVGKHQPIVARVTIGIFPERPI